MVFVTFGVGVHETFSFGVGTLCRVLYNIVLAVAIAILPTILLVVLAFVLVLIAVTSTASRVPPSVSTTVGFLSRSGCVSEVPIERLTGALLSRPPLFSVFGNADTACERSATALTAVTSCIVKS